MLTTYLVCYTNPTVGWREYMAFAADDRDHALEQMASADPTAQVHFASYAATCDRCGERIAYDGARWVSTHDCARPESCSSSRHHFPGDYGPPRIAISYQIVTPESAADGETSETGWDVTPEDADALDPEGIDLDCEACGGAGVLTDGAACSSCVVAAAVKFLRDEGSGLEASGGPEWHRGLWYSDTEAAHDRAYFEEGEERTRSFHLYGFTQGQERAIYREMFPRAKR